MIIVLHYDIIGQSMLFSFICYESWLHTNILLHTFTNSNTHTHSFSFTHVLIHMDDYYDNSSILLTPIDYIYTIIVVRRLCVCVCVAAILYALQYCILHDWGIAHQIRDFQIRWYRIFVKIIKKKSRLLCSLLICYLTLTFQQLTS